VLQEAGRHALESQSQLDGLGASSYHQHSSSSELKQYDEHSNSRSGLMAAAGLASSRGESGNKSRSRPQTASTNDVVDYSEYGL
jgi:hypothetical protein